jgi:sec-independent protein translocase protein TatA
MFILAFLQNLGWTEIILIVFLALLLFGGKKLPGLAKDLGQGIREFRKSLFNTEEEEAIDKKTEVTGSTKPEKKTTKR